MIAALAAFIVAAVCFGGLALWFAADRVRIALAHDALIDKNERLVEALDDAQREAEQSHAAARYALDAGAELVEQRDALRRRLDSSRRSLIAVIEGMPQAHQVFPTLAARDGEKQIIAMAGGVH